LSKEIAVAWKIRIKRGVIEVEVVGMTPDGTKNLFDTVCKEHKIM
jgi:hypothetical protein